MFFDGLGIVSVFIRFESGHSNDAHELKTLLPDMTCTQTVTGFTVQTRKIWLRSVITD